MPVRSSFLFCKRVIFLALLCLLPITVFANMHNEEPLSSKRILFSQKEFNYRIFTHRVEVLDVSGAAVFSAQAPLPDARAIACGRTDSFGFHAFFNRHDQKTGQWFLYISRQFGPPVPAIRIPEAVYSPTLIAESGNAVVAIREAFTMSVWDLDSGRTLWEKQFDTPVLTPETTRIQGAEAVRFLRFSEGKYRWFHFFTADLGRGAPVIIGPEKAADSPRLPISPGNVPLDPRTILAFGDSITFGYVDYQRAPALGYVPRLGLLLEAEYPGMTIQNAGIPAENTVMAMERYELVLSNSGATYFLFHEGTNDAIDVNLPVSTTLFNIRTIMQYALDLGMSPILTTIIPRKPTNWTGVGIPRQRAEEIRSGILAVASDLSIPCIDFWAIFSNYPEPDGGYLSLMSDYVHPSPAGYQVMAETFHTRLLGLPPSAPQNIGIALSNPYRVMISWQPNSEFDLSGYQLDYGYSADQMDRHVSTAAPQFTFLRPPFQGDLNRHRFVRIRAEDRYGNLGSESETLMITFPESASGSVSIKSIQKQIPRVKRIPVKSEDNSDTLR